MKAFVAPIIHARTKDVDFRSGLLTIPENFKDSDVQWARKYILDSTRYFELAGEDGRWTAFCNKDVVVTGVSIYIENLYKKCNRRPCYAQVDGRRKNYAFIGFVIQKSDITEAFDVPYSMLLEQYEKYMELRWDDSIDDTSNSLLATRAKYQSVYFPTAEGVSNVLRLYDQQKKTVLDLGVDSLESILARLMLIMKDECNLSFCSDMPNATSVIESQFQIVTSRNAHGIISTIQKRAESQQTRRQEEFTGMENKPVYGKKKSDAVKISEMMESQTANSNRQSRENKISVDYKDIGLVLGTAAGVVFIIISKGSSPIILAISNMFTIILGGAEAVRIIRKFT
ncbi:MAG: hypothetical protein K2I96_04780 [Lachnospiraceae bacterium]|nr:hypothetical protein [Lachnospiraceae bacterium]